MADDEVPAGKQRNGFTGEIEDAAPLHLAPSPTDQRKLASPDTPDDRPLIDQVRERVENDTARNVDGHYMPDVETPHEDITTSIPGKQLEDVPAVNTQLRREGHPVAPIEQPEQQTSVKSTRVTAQEDQESPRTESQASEESPSEDSTNGEN